MDNQQISTIKSQLSTLKGIDAAVRNDYRHPMWVKRFGSLLKAPEQTEYKLYGNFNYPVLMRGVHLSR